MENSLAKKHKELSKEWSDCNLPITPEEVSYGSNKKVWWRGRCGHEWEASVKNWVFVWPEISSGYIHQPLDEK